MRKRVREQAGVFFLSPLKVVLSGEGGLLSRLLWAVSGKGTTKEAHKNS